MLVAMPNTLDAAHEVAGWFIGLVAEPASCLCERCRANACAMPNLRMQLVWMPRMRCRPSGDLTLRMAMPVASERRYGCPRHLRSSEEIGCRDPWLIYPEGCDAALLLLNDTGDGSKDVVDTFSVLVQRL